MQSDIFGTVAIDCSAQCVVDGNILQLNIFAISYLDAVHNVGTVIKGDDLPYLNGHFARFEFTIETHHLGRKQLGAIVKDISCTTTWPKRMRIKMTTLAAIMGETRLQVSKALRQMEAKGQVSLSREQIIFLRCECR